MGPTILRWTDRKIGDGLSSWWLRKVWVLKPCYKGMAKTADTSTISNGK